MKNITIFKAISGVPLVVLACSLVFSPIVSNTVSAASVLGNNPARESKGGNRTTDSRTSNNASATSSSAVNNTTSSHSYNDRQNNNQKNTRATTTNARLIPGIIKMINPWMTNLVGTSSSSQASSTKSNTQLNAVQNTSIYQMLTATTSPTSIESVINAITKSAQPKPNLAAGVGFRNPKSLAGIANIFQPSNEYTGGLSETATASATLGAVSFGLLGAVMAAGKFALFG